MNHFADLLGIAPSRLSRAMGPRSQPFDIQGCLKLAEVTKESPDVILRAAGRSRLADQLLHLYGPVSVQLTEEEQELLTAYHGIRHRHAQLAYLAIGKAMDDSQRHGQGSAALATTVHPTTSTDVTATIPVWPAAAGDEHPRRRRG